MPRTKKPKKPTTTKRTTKAKKAVTREGELLKDIDRLNKRYQNIVKQFTAKSAIAEQYRMAFVRLVESEGGRRAGLRLTTTKSGLQVISRSMKNIRDIAAAETAIQTVLSKDLKTFRGLQEQEAERRTSAANRRIVNEYQKRYNEYVSQLDQPSPEPGKTNREKWRELQGIVGGDEFDYIKAQVGEEPEKVTVKPSEVSAEDLIKQEQKWYQQSRERSTTTFDSIKNELYDLAQSGDEKAQAALREMRRHGKSKSEDTAAKEYSIEVVMAERSGELDTLEVKDFTQRQKAASKAVSEAQLINRSNLYNTRITNRMRKKKGK